MYKVTAMQASSWYLEGQGTKDSKWMRRYEKVTLSVHETEDEAIAEKRHQIRQNRKNYVGKMHSFDVEAA